MSAGAELGVVNDPSGARALDNEAPRISEPAAGAGERFLAGELCERNLYPHPIPTFSTLSGYNRRITWSYINRRRGLAVCFFRNIIN